MLIEMPAGDADNVRAFLLQHLPIVGVSVFGVEPFLGLVLVIPLMAMVGWALQRLVLERSARGGLLVPVLSTFGLSIILDNLLFQGFGADTRSLAPYIGDLSYDSWTLSDDISIGKLAALTMAMSSPVSPDQPSSDSAGM